MEELLFYMIVRKYIEMKIARGAMHKLTFSRFLCLLHKSLKYDTTSTDLLQLIGNMIFSIQPHHPPITRQHNLLQYNPRFTLETFHALK